jgi:hypothetical protein
LLINIKTFTKSAKFHEIFNGMLGMSAGHLTYDVRECLARGRRYHDNLQITSPFLNRGRCYHDINHPLSSGCLRGEREGDFRMALQRMPGTASNTYNPVAYRYGTVE